MAIPIYEKFYDFKQNLEKDCSQYYNYLNEALEFYSELNELFSKYSEGMTFNEFKELAEKPTKAENYFLRLNNIEFGKGNFHLELIFKDLATAIDSNLTHSKLGKLRLAAEVEKILNYILQELPKYPALNSNQTQKVGLLIRSGIIQFLREKNPKISNNQIAGFIQLLTQEPMKKESINPHLGNDKENPKHPLHKVRSTDDADTILKKFGISPQADS